VDVRLYARVLWRFKFVVALGFLAAVALTFLSIASVSLKGGSPQVRYRQSETWLAQTTLLITQSGFPDGRSVTPVFIPPASTSGKAQSIVPTFADPSRFSSLALLYSRYANSDAVRNIMLRRGPILGTFSAQPVYTSDASNAGTLPLMTMSGYATSPTTAQAISARGSSAFITFLHRQQAAAGIPDDQRVIVREVNQPLQPVLLAGRKKTVPILIFVTMMTLAIGLAFILENMRPRVHEIVATRTEIQPEVRRSA
jgi:hypothetical protein